MNPETNLYRRRRVEQGQGTAAIHLKWLIASVWLNIPKLRDPSCGSDFCHACDTEGYTPRGIMLSAGTFPL